MSNYYKPLDTVNNQEQSTYGRMQAAFDDAIDLSNKAQTNMISSYIQTVNSRRTCHAACPKGGDSDTLTWKKDVEHDATDTSDGAAGGFEDVVNACKAGCDLRWPGIVQNESRTLGVDGGKNAGIYTDSNKQRDTITSCGDLSKYSPKIKLDGVCKTNTDCESELCATGKNCSDPQCISRYENIPFMGSIWDKICHNDSGCKDVGCKWEKDTASGRCAIISTDVFDNTIKPICKRDMKKLRLNKWAGNTQYLNHNGWVKVKDYGFNWAPEIANQREKDGKYISDINTAIKAAEAYGDYCVGFYSYGGLGFILQSSDGKDPKPNWSDFVSKTGILTETFTIDTESNNRLSKKTIKPWQSLSDAAGGETIISTTYNDPTFPIANVNAAIKKTCPRGWEKIRDGKSCGIFNDTMKIKEGSGWDGSSFGCNLPDTDAHYGLNCHDIQSKSFTCWAPSGSTVKPPNTGCKTIKGQDIEGCLLSGGKVRNDLECPVTQTMIVWIGKHGLSYFAERKSIQPNLDILSTNGFPGARLASKKEMADVIAKNIAVCEYGWFGDDVATASNSYPSNTKTGSGCGDGKHGLVGVGKITGGIYLSLSGTQEFVKQRLDGLGYTTIIVESHQKLIEAPPQTTCPKDHPFVYRPYHGNDYCCKTNKNINGVTFQDGNSGSCYGSEYQHCSNPPCVDYGTKEGFTALEADMVGACEESGTHGGKLVPGVLPKGDFLFSNRKKEKSAFQKLQRMQTSVKNSIEQLQSDNLKVNAAKKTQNIELLKKLFEYGNTRDKLLKSENSLDTLSAQQVDNSLKKGSVDMGYYLWLTLAISILGIAISKIK